MNLRRATGTQTVDPRLSAAPLTHPLCRKALLQPVCWECKQNYGSNPVRFRGNLTRVRHFSSSDSAAAAAAEKNPKKSLRIIDPKDRAASIHRSEPIAWRGSKAYKAWVGSGATGSPQVLPGGLARKCPVDIFAEAAISKECLSAEDSSRPSE
ncbi:hypothetical protein DP73_02465 [Desulfosporosinus sp. HMP52]|uniref:hypothetical protein n=1 Tax=Desulfosporosinus sp. HMP52 TaxID=1487923 RepID=UPI00051FB524|nr:hypothetical protein [Desulfosporosinus sp. HMP52]KGK91608.1 hypothetical protein DP73_02465 [Desulfosporosinus sp. HMP52]